MACELDTGSYDRRQADEHSHNDQFCAGTIFPLKEYNLAGCKEEAVSVEYIPPILFDATTLEFNDADCLSNAIWGKPMISKEALSIEFSCHSDNKFRRKRVMID